MQAPSPPGYGDCDTGGVDLTELSPLEADALLDPRRERDIARWAERLGVSKDELRRAAERAGPRVGDIREHLIGGFTSAGPSS